jgi:hypothetical protein
MTLSIYAAAYYDENGIHVRLFKSLGGAVRWKEGIAKEYWDCHFSDPLPTNKTDNEIAHHYFSFAPEGFEVTHITEIEE